MSSTHARAPSRSRRLIAALAGSIALLPAVAGAAAIYVLDAVLERDGVESVSPTFIVTPGERALLVFDGERDLDIAMTLTPRDGADAAAVPSEAGEGEGRAAEEGRGAVTGETFDLKVELIDGVQSSGTTVVVSLAETETIELDGRTIRVLVSEQAPLGETAPASAPAEEGAGN